MGLTIVIHTISTDDDGNVSIQAGVVRPKFDQDFVASVRDPEEVDELQAKHDARQLMYQRLHLGTAQLEQGLG